MVKVYTHEVSGIQFLGGHTEKEKAEIKDTHLEKRRKLLKTAINNQPLIIIF